MKEKFYHFQKFHCGEEEVVFWLELRGRGGCISLADARVCLCVVSNPAKRAYIGGWGVVAEVGEAHDGASVDFGKSVGGNEGFPLQPEKDIESPSSTRLEALGPPMTREQ